MATSQALGIRTTERGLNLRIAYKELERVKSEWFTIGIQLGIPRDKLVEFEKTEDPLSAAVNYWLEGNVSDPAVPICWETIVTALQSDYVGEAAVGWEISRDHCVAHMEDDTSTEDETTEKRHDRIDDSMHPDVREDLEFILENNLRKIIAVYASYVDTIRGLVKDKGVTPEELRDYLLALPAFSKPSTSNQKLGILGDKEDELKECNSIAEIFCFLITRCTSFLDYEIFQDIHDYFEVHEENDRLNYPHHLEYYINRHKVSEFITVNPLLRKYAKGTEKLIVKYDIKVTSKLAVIKHLKQLLARVLDIHPSAIQIVDMQEGCILVTYYIPATIADALFNPDTVFTPEQVEEFRSNSVAKIGCNAYVYDFREKKQVASTDGQATVTNEDIAMVPEV